MPWTTPPKYTELWSPTSEELLSHLGHCWAKPAGGTPKGVIAPILRNEPVHLTPLPSLPAFSPLDSLRTLSPDPSPGLPPDADNLVCSYCCQLTSEVQIAFSSINHPPRVTSMLAPVRIWSPQWHFRQLYPWILFKGMKAPCHQCSSSLMKSFKSHLHPTATLKPKRTIILCFE